MMYLSKGLLIRKNENILTVSHCGAEYDLMDERAAVWESGRKEPREVDEVRRVSRRTGVWESGWQEPQEIINNNQEKILLELSKTGLAETSPDTGNEAVFRILINCAICPIEKLAFPALWSQPERRLYKWLTKAGLRLTIAELVYLNQNKIKPVSELLGEVNRQALTETIYNSNSISDGILESLMERSPERDNTVNTVIKLLHRKVIFLV